MSDELLNEFGELSKEEQLLSIQLKRANLKRLREV
jgi:hypothetical protein